MNLTDYDERAPLNTDINPRASQAVAAAKRARPSDDAPPVTARPQHHLIAGVVGVLAVLGVLALAISQHGSVPHARPLAITPLATEAVPTAVGSSIVRNAAPTSTPVLSQFTRATPSVAPEPFGDVLEASGDAPPMVGRGLTISSVDLAAPTPAPPPEPSYIENVGAQAPHCIRTCDGQPGPNGGDWVAVPTAAPAMLSVIGAQQPHKVR